MRILKAAVAYFALVFGSPHRSQQLRLLDLGWWRP